MSVVLRKVDYVTAPQSYWFFLEQIIPTFQLQLICLRNQKGHSLENERFQCSYSGILLID